MQIHPLVTVKKAASVLGMDKDTIRSKLVSGEIQGERRRVGEKEKWFLYAGAVENLLEKKLPEIVERADRVSVDGMEEVFDDEAQESELQTELEMVEAEPQMESEERALVEPIVDINELLQTLTIEFAYRLSEERQTIYRLEQQLLEKEQLARRLPDLEQNLKEEHAVVLTKDTEIKSLRIQIGLLEGKIEHMRRPWWKRLFTSPVGV